MAEGIDRRRLIKGAGIGAAAAWSAPLIVRMGPLATAASPPGATCPQFECRPGTLVPCGPEPVPPAGLCFCYLGTDGQGHCTGCGLGPECTSTAQCGPGDVCISLGGDCTLTGLCFAPCGDPRCAS